MEVAKTSGRRKSRLPMKRRTAEVIRTFVDYESDSKCTKVDTAAEGFDLATIDTFYTYSIAAVTSLIPHNADFTQSSKEGSLHLGSQNPTALEPDPKGSVLQLQKGTEDEAVKEVVDNKNEETAMLPFNSTLVSSRTTSSSSASSSSSLSSCTSSPSLTFLQYKPSKAAFSCPECDFSCKSVSCMDRHLEGHRGGKKMFRCPLCDFTTARKGSLMRHQLTHSDCKPLSCPQCDFCTKRVENLKVHMLRHDKNALKFSCDMCNFSALEKGSLYRHQRLVHSNERPFVCSICGFATKQAHDLKKHIMTHTGERPFKCDLCDYSCAKSSGLKQHRLVHLKEKPHRCHLCDYTCTQAGCLKKHIARHSQPTKFSCLWCEYTCQQKSTLDKHVRSNHQSKERRGRKANKDVVCAVNNHNGGDDINVSKDGDDDVGVADNNGVGKRVGKRDSDVPGTANSEDRLSCQLCQFKCEQSPVLKAHMIGHAASRGEAPDKCPECSYRSSILSVLKRHFLQAHYPDSRSYRCTLCGYASHTQESLERHVKMRHQPSPRPPHQCPECSYTCRFRHSLKEHMLKHSGDAPFRCDKCEFKCYKLANLQRHRSTVHSTYKPFQCETEPGCGYSCKTAAEMKLHVRQHLEKSAPFSCNLCSYATFKSSNLRRHMLRHSEEKPILCPLCDYSCKREEHLRAHTATHHTYTCGDCGKAVVGLNTYNEHQRSHRGCAGENDAIEDDEDEDGARKYVTS